MEAHFNWPPRLLRLNTMSPEMHADYAQWCQRRAIKEAKGTFESARDALAATIAQLPETAAIPIAETLEGRRMASFKDICPPEFCQKVRRDLLANPAAFDAVTAWDGSHPGPLCHGTTGTRKTGACWSVLGALYVRRNLAFHWMPVRRLITDIGKAEADNETDGFFRSLSHRKIVFIDDLDKFNPQFQSEPSALFAFYDWAYRTHHPVIATTNQPLAWWEERMGSAFARRLFGDAHRPIQF